jgi:hypothetical protein
VREGCAALIDSKKESIAVDGFPVRVPAISRHKHIAHYERVTKSFLLDAKKEQESAIEAKGFLVFKKMGF